MTYLDPDGYKNIAWDKDEISFKYYNSEGMPWTMCPPELNLHPGVAFTPNDAHQAQDLQATSVSTPTPDDAHHHRDQGVSLKGSYDVSDIQSLDKDLKKATVRGQTVRPSS